MPDQTTRLTRQFQRIEVSLGERSYPIVIGSGLLDGHPELAKRVSGRQVAIVSNSVVDPLYGDRVAMAIAPHARSVLRIVLPDGEAHKEWSTLNQIFDSMLAAHFERNALILALGGGRCWRHGWICGCVLSARHRFRASPDDPAGAG